MRIACVGGGPAGLYFALLMKLHGPGHEITVFERNAADSTQGWGVTFGPPLLGQLYGNDPESAQAIGQAAFSQLDQVYDIHGKQVLYPGSGCYGISRQRLLDILACRARGLGVRIEFDHEVMTARLPAADLIVACDGANSRMRLEAGRFQTEVRVSGNKYLWLGTDKVFESFTYPFVHTDSGWVWAYCYGIGDGLSTFLVECSPGTWAGLGFDTLPPQGGISVLERLFERHLDGRPLFGLAPQGASAGWLNFRTITNRRWHDGNVVLAGDAAHTTHYTIGAGTTLAIGDAIVLARSLQHHGEQALALRSYERRRKAELLRAQRAAGLSARWFESVPRYARLEPREFSALMHDRWSPLLPYLPPRLYYRLRQAAQGVPVPGKHRGRAACGSESVLAAADYLAGGRGGDGDGLPVVAEAQVPESRS
jgi:2-polyprenyl-6-methoxyphenol hydroxylase-like FAD-dependent oxidoreductase